MSPAWVPVDGSRARSALASLAAISPYFEADVLDANEHPAPTASASDVEHARFEPVAVAELNSGGAALAAAVDGVNERLGGVERRVAASTLALGHAARLWSVALGTWATSGIVPDLDPAVLRVQPRLTAPLRLIVDRPAGWRPAPAASAAPRTPAASAAPGTPAASAAPGTPAASAAPGTPATPTTAAPTLATPTWPAVQADGHLEAADLIREVIVERNLRPYFAAVRAETGLALGLLWGNAASALVGATGMLIRFLRTQPNKASTAPATATAARPARACAEATAAGIGRLTARLLATPPLAGTTVHSLTPDGQLVVPSVVRRSCCLFYRVPGGGTCGDCPLDRP
ncbi:hypothetical protein ACG83_04230 [Frankia sp. R43]|uniref:(2Fe-2S)-binding protein n=1 Tax=Frankia sp. R43 TaxID=269536 RepID=UPI0006CA0B73|nr:(2Fe-2S)-binding protein [Frankia sp. R43]KPM57019.1 hypothetical protein ACG83_04230 [Frankia sp. R43]